MFRATKQQNFSGPKKLLQRFFGPKSCNTTWSNLPASHHFFGAFLAGKHPEIAAPFQFLGDNATFQMVAFLTEIEFGYVIQFPDRHIPPLNQSTSGMPCWLCCSRHWALDSFHVTGRLIMITSRGLQLLQLDNWSS